VLTGIFSLFMLGASIAPKLIGTEVASMALVAVGWSARSALMIGFIELGGVALYLYPRTNVLGAILMTGLLGGAMAANIRVGNPLFSHVLFRIYLGLFMWGGHIIRAGRIRKPEPFPASVHRPVRHRTRGVAESSARSFCGHMKLRPVDLGLCTKFSKNRPLQ